MVMQLKVQYQQYKPKMNENRHAIWQYSPLNQIADVIKHLILRVQPSINVFLVLISSTLTYFKKSDSTTVLNFKTVILGGICWGSVSKTGNCKKMIMLNVTKEQCCSVSRGPDTGWSPHSTSSSGLLFFWEFLSKGAPACQTCHSRSYL